ncbi:MAG: aminotransferase class I/II-fold pyridoxal phosphate-dependent enzyme [Armatimonadota bacterium]|nr:aminotransferase class I/II-fold pyridoxal phosphate-dependent enzyme [Armatimonadota bacterium]MDR7448542.1 aminotransferase class I/II-fold pyridoxal phosphate-dependent enzyme [Armatimonadota bacterium]MDR7460225.1 aminotransferase class I/II-fold pyridoxal phosphate-dependent enzyme [Armatimonadota bacterium]MDR7478945.1 aminotransferase class I/II-fold pyridoxal phosphate-dependent enzyme [Armatimonadota bacterium]MDR7488343.1 aminotransferase class I/II-fold pyridoxal phosphate-depende
MAVRGFNTRAVHGDGWRDPLGAVSPPIYESTTFRYRTVAEGAALGADRGEGYYYTRWGNPTTQALEARVALLEGAEAAIATGSGMGAISTVVLGLVGRGDLVVAPRAVYQATYELFTQVLPAYGVEVTLLDRPAVEAYEAALRPTTRLVYVETPNNPLLDITDIAAVARLARDRGALTVVDNTFATPYNQQPLALGADLVVHSLTKYLGGHADVTAGIFCGSRELVLRLRPRFRIFGPVLDPFGAWLVLRGVRTLGVRMERHNQNGQRLAEFLAAHPRVERVHYPGLLDHPGHAVARRQMRGFGGMLSFEVRGGFEAGVRVVEGLRLATMAVSLGSLETLVTHPASTTSVGIRPEDRARAGIREGLIRVSVGIEDADDLIADFGQALDRA